MTKLYSYLFFGLLTLILLGSGCRSEYEQVRTSGNPERILAKADEYFENKDYAKAQGLYELIISSFKGKKEAEDIFFRYAYSYYYQDRFLLSSYYFNNFAQTYPTSDRREEADFMVADSYYQLSPVYRLDQTYTDKAIESYQLFANTYPSSDRIKVANSRIDEMRLKQEKKVLAEGRLYLDLRQYQSAVRTLDNLLKEFPDTDNGEEVRYLITLAQYRLAKNSFIEKQIERYTAAADFANNYLRKYPQSRHFNEVNTLLKDSQKEIKRIENVRDKVKGSRSRS